MGYVTVVEEVRKEPSWFTQGWEIKDEGGREVVYESTGLYGASRVVKWDLLTGDVLRETANSAKEFGEGLTVVGDRVRQLLWRENGVREYDRETLSPVDGARATHGMKDGWGLAYSAGRGEVAGTDGSHRLYLLDPETLETRAVREVTDNGRAVGRLNEVEWVNGEVWANIWLTDCVARIDPDSGAVRQWLLMDNVAARLRSTDGGGRPDVLNGIAVSERTGAVWVTGKKWHRAYRVEVSRQTDEASDLAVARDMCIRDEYKF